MRDHDRTLLMVRHGRTVWHGQDRFTGQLDVPLSRDGVMDAQRAAEVLSAFRPDFLISSDLSRARQTADVIGQRCQLRTALDERLQEEHLGAWAGLSHDEVSQRFPDEYGRWRRGDVLEAGTEREGLRTVALRGETAVNEAMTSNNGRVGVVVTHLNTAIATMARLLRLESEDWLAMGDLALGSFSVISRCRDGRWILIAHNVLLHTNTTVERGHGSRLSSGKSRSH